MMKNTSNNITLNDNAQAEFIRLPRAGYRCPITGLSRSKLNQLILPCKENGFKAPVRSICLKTQPWHVKGTRLIHLESLRCYLLSQMETNQTEAA